MEMKGQLELETEQLSRHLERKRAENDITSGVYQAHFGKGQIEAFRDETIAPERMRAANAEAYALIEKRLGPYDLNK